MAKVFIGGAWPYANGSLHLGRLASLLPGDVVARYFFIANLANLLQPFIPFSCEKIRTFLTLERPSWQLIIVPAGLQVQKLELLFERIDVSRIEEELSLLEKQKI